MTILKTTLSMYRLDPGGMGLARLFGLAGYVGGALTGYIYARVKKKPKLKSTVIGALCGPAALAQLLALRRPRQRAMVESSGSEGITSGHRAMVSSGMVETQGRIERQVASPEMK